MAPPEPVEPGAFDSAGPRGPHVSAPSATRRAVWRAWTTSPAHQCGSRSGRNRRYRGGAHYRRAGRHLQGPERGHAGFQSCAYPLDLRAAHGIYGGHHVLARACVSRAISVSRAELSDPEMGCCRGVVQRHVLFTAIRRRGTDGPLLDHDEYRSHRRDARPARAHHARNVAIAALAVLLIMPQSLFDPSFEMSFGWSLNPGRDGCRGEGGAALGPGAADRHASAILSVGHAFAHGDQDESEERGKPTQARSRRLSVMPAEAGIQ